MNTSGSASNLFVFKNGWTSSQQVRQNGNQGNSKGLSNPTFKNRPQSSNYAGYRRKGLAGANAPNSANRIWKYNNGQVSNK